VQVEDRGCGFEPDTALRSPRSHGLVGMRERVQLFQGRLTIDSAPGHGTRVTAELPFSSILEHTATDA